MGKAPFRRPRHLLLLATGLAAALLLAGCDELGSPTLPPFSPAPIGSPAASPLDSPTPRLTPRPTPPPWPTGWDESFCGVFGDVATAQELAVDVPRAIEEEATDDALALARELRQMAPVTEEQLGELPEWEPAQPAIETMASLMDIGSRAGRQWIRFLDDGRRAGRNRARELNEEMRPLVEQANQALAELAGMGLECPEHSLSLESP